MRTLALTSAIAAAITLASVTSADAWQRNSKFSGPRGDSAVTASGSCADRSCARDVSKTGAAGRTFTRNGGRSCADGACSANRTSTGPNGQSASRSTTFTR